jgi:hypothetical protein
MMLFARQRRICLEVMPTNVVNLDALIPREDFAITNPSKSTSVDRISIVHLDGHYFASDLRKPDFQRETTHWSPEKVCDLVGSFLDADLIPAVILWKAGGYIFVIDGAHRLSALLAWIHDDYGDRQRSRDYCGGYIPPEQEEIGDRTRRLINDEIKSYAEYQAYKNNKSAAPADMQRRLSNLADHSIVAEWVRATELQSAEKSYFKINQSATPIDPTERRLLRSRDSASAIAARAITHAGGGHKYWGDFDQAIQTQIETISRDVNHVLFQPPLSSGVITTLDVPIAGRGYNILPFVFDFINQVNGVPIADSTSRRTDTKDKLEADKDGARTLEFLKQTENRLARLTGDEKSLGLHPIVYFYTRSGTFQPTVFLAVLKFIDDLIEKDRLITFTRVRQLFEGYLIGHKEAVSLIVHRFGSGSRSIRIIHDYLHKIFDGFARGDSLDQVFETLKADQNYAFATAPRPNAARPPAIKKKRAFNRGTKSAAFINQAIVDGNRCRICWALLHTNSIQFDHKNVPRRADGPTNSSNAQVTHPFCNSAKEQIGQIAYLANPTGEIINETA